MRITGALWQRGAAAVGALTLVACGQSESDKRDNLSAESTASSTNAANSSASATGGFDTNGQTATVSSSTAGNASNSSSGAGGSPASSGSTQGSASAGGSAGSDTNATTSATGVRCVPEGAFCRALPGDCPDFQVRAVDGNCWGECVPIEECVCDEPADCPDENQYTCHNSAGRCGPYLM